jgi:transcriptional regulator with XRE-family HTH domain
MKKEQEEFGARLRAALQTAKLPESATDLARLVPRHGGTAVTTAAAHRWIKGQSIPRARNLRALAALLRVPLSSLYGDTSSANRVREPKEAWQASVIDRHAIEAFLFLEDRQRKLVRELIASLAKAQETGS